MVYFVCFALSSIVIYYGTHQSRVKELHFFILAIIPLIILATFRSDSVGIDVLVYIKNYFSLAVKSDSFENYRRCVDTELGYQIVNYAISRFTDDIAWLHFVNSMLITAPVMMSIYLLRNEISASAAFLTYLCFYYNYNTMNQVRQGIAMSFVVLGIVFIYKGKKAYGIMLLVAACLFHLSAILGIVVLIYSLLIDMDDFKKRKYILLLTVTLVAFLITNYSSLLNYLLRYLPTYYSMKYSHYLKIEKSNIHNAIGISYMITKLFAISISYRLYKMRYNTKFNAYLFTIQLISLLLVPVATQIDFGYRFLRYMDIFEILIFPQLPLIFTDRGYNYMFVKFFSVIYVIGYWIVNTVINNQGGTLPYLTH